MFEDVKSSTQLAELENQRNQLMQENRALQRRALLEMPDETLPTDAERIADSGLTEHDRLVNPRVAQIVEKQHWNHLKLQARQEAESFVAANSDYCPSQANFAGIVGYLTLNNLAPTQANFQLAYEKLKAAGLIESAPVDAGTTAPEGRGFTDAAAVEAMSADEFAKWAGLKRVQNFEHRPR